MNIYYTRHARQRMTQRKVSDAQVLDVLSSPGEIWPGDLNEQTAVRQFLDFELRVVYEEIDGVTVKIITVIKIQGSLVIKEHHAN